MVTLLRENLCKNIKGWGRRQPKALSSPVHQQVEAGEMEAVTDSLLKTALSNVEMAAFFRPQLIVQVPESAADIMKVGWLGNQSL